MPARFSSELKINKNFTKVLGFKMYLPSDRVYNCLVECGDLFSAIGDDDKPATSPDDRRLTEHRLVLKPTRSFEDDVSRDPSQFAVHTSDNSEEDESLSHSIIHDQHKEDTISESGGHAPGEISVAMGSLRFHPGADGEAEDTAVQELLFPQMSVELVVSAQPEPASQYLISIHPQEAQDKLAMAMYPFLQVGYASDYWAAATMAAAVSKPLMAVVLWGSLDDASC